MAASLKGGRTRDEVPVEEIQAAIDANEHPRVLVWLKRKNVQGHMISLAGKTEHALEELFHAEEWIEPLAGGGKYQVQVTDINRQGIEVVPPFWVYIEGPAKTPQQVRAALGGGGGGVGAPASVGGGPMYPGFPYPPYPYPYPEPGEQPDPRQFWNQPPDAVAQENTRAMRKELEKKEDEHRKEREELLKRVDKLMERLADAEKRHAEALAKEQFARLEEKLRALEKGGTSTKESTTAELVKAAGLFAPVLVAMVQGSKDSKALDVQQQQKAQELQLATLSTFMKSNAGSFTELLKIALPVVAPVLIKMFEERSPSKMAELIGTMGESNLTMFSMVGEMMKQIMPDQPDNPWMGVINQGLETLKNMAEQMAKVSKPGSTLAKPVEQQQQQPQPTNGTPEDHAKAIADVICAEPSIDVELRTTAWHEIYVAIHRMDDPDAVADRIGKLLTRLAQANKLPVDFAHVFEDASRAPHTFLKPLLNLLPIVQRPQYVEALLKAFDDTFEPDDAAQAAP